MTPTLTVALQWLGLIGALTALTLALARTQRLLTAIRDLLREIRGDRVR